MMPLSKKPNHSDTCVIIFAKFPALGMAKTRLQPALGVAGAAQMARRLLLHSIEQALGSGFRVQLCVSPAPTDPCWRSLDLAEIPFADDLLWCAQAEGDLGVRMLTASTQALATFERVLLIGSDCPDLRAAQLQQAARQLDTHDTVMIPAVDGGYVLLGFTQVDVSVFVDIKWSTSGVAAVTKRRIAALGWSQAVLAPLPDIDDPADLQYLPIGWLER